MTLNDISSAGVEFEADGKVRRLSPFTLGVRARLNAWLRRRYCEHHKLVSLLREDAEAYLAGVEQRLLAGEADFGHGGGGPETWAHRQLDTLDCQIELLRLLLGIDSADEAAALLVRHTDAVGEALKAVFRASAAKNA